MRVLHLLAIFSLAACGSAGSGALPAASTPAITPSQTAPVGATGPARAPIASMSVTGAHAFVRAQVTQSAPVLLPEAATPHVLASHGPDDAAFWRPAHALRP